MSVLIMDGNTLEYIWQGICNSEIIFHPRYSSEGIPDHEAMLNFRSKKKLHLLLDRNLLSSLLNLSRNGSLKNENEMRLLSLLMTWAIMNDFSVNPGLALMEHATRMDDSLAPRLELSEFNNIFDFYPSNIWLRLTLGMIDEIPICPTNVAPFVTKVEYNVENDNLLMHTAEMLRIVYLFKRSDLSPVEKMLDFLDWNYKNLLICESTIAYAAMLFTNQEGVKPPKYSGGHDIQRILRGCKNQAWDLTYLSGWSYFHYKEETMNDIFMFATNDTLLKMIFINAYANGGVNALIESIFYENDVCRINEIIHANQGNKRVKPDFGSNPKKYFLTLINQEKQKIIQMLE